MKVLSTTTNYIFGYGSLLCPKSRGITAPRLANNKYLQGETSPLPVIVHNVERSWTARGMGNDGDDDGDGGGDYLTYVSLQKKTGSKCAGVLIEVNDMELQQFDIRESGYDRVLVDINDVDHINSISSSIGSSISDNSNIWMYIHTNPLPASSVFPIAQSYVDIILRGALTISEEFARSFLDTTYGWHHDYDHNHDNNNDSSTSRNYDIREQQHCSHNKNTYYVWIDDRHKPLYVRSDIEYSLSMSHHLDKLIKEHQSDALSKRILI